MNIRVINAMIEIKMNDTSFTDKGFMGIVPKYRQSEVRDIWLEGIELGIEEGLNIGSLEGQRIQITTNIKNERHKEFYDKFLKLAQKYKCAIQYHPRIGMCVIDREYNG